MRVDTNFPRAEYFSWEDGNPNNEDRSSLFVCQGNDGIRLANNNADYIGITYATHDPDYDKNRASFIKKLFAMSNHDNQKYMSRKDNPKWVCVGIIGEYVVRDDGTCYPGCYCSIVKDGTVTKSDIGFKVIRRIDSKAVSVYLE